MYNFKNEKCSSDECNLEDCENTDRKRVIDFLSGLTFLNGSMCKITKNQFEIRLG